MNPEDGDPEYPVAAPPLRMAILGAGALGATFGFLLADAGVDVTLIDVDAGKIAVLER